MSDERMVSMSAEQYADIERYILALMRSHQNERAARMMSLSLAYKFAKPIEPPLPSNVIEFRGGTTGELRSSSDPRTVAPAAQHPPGQPPASVTPLPGSYSRRVPCS